MLGTVFGVGKAARRPSKAPPNNVLGTLLPRALGFNTLKHNPAGGPRLDEERKAIGRYTLVRISCSSSVGLGTGDSSAMAIIEVAP